jgi:uncharacterized membrane protein SirB2
MIEFYPQIKQAHILLALSSGAIFALRGGGSLLGMQWSQWLTVRMTSYAVDTSLLTAAMMLLVILPRAMYANGWLATKIVLIVVYIVLGIFALRRARTRSARAICYAAALAVFGFIYTIARAHHPLGFLYRWLE